LGRRQSSMSESTWEFRHSVDCNATRGFAWKYWTNVANWDDPPAIFHLAGRFEVGSVLTTVLPGQTWHSVIRDVSLDREATIELQLLDAVLSFNWKFEDLEEDRARITQRLALTGANAKSFVAEVVVFEHSVPDGMNKLASAIERARIEAGRG
jgi:hypothetical protein